MADKYFMTNQSQTRIDVAISTVDRPKKYLHKLMPRLRDDLPVRLVVGSPKYDYLERYAQKPCIEIIGVKPADWERFKHFSVLHRALWNYWRCLVQGARPGRRNGLLVLEDDVLPARGWEERFYQTIDRIESEYGDQFVLALHTWYTELSKPDGNRFYNPYPPASFGGTQAMYYPEPVRVAFAEYLKREGVDSFRTAYDYMLREYLLLTGIPCFATTPCLFKHIGVVSTGLSMGFATAAHFKKNLAKTKR
jgi:hypothetical protein